MVNNQEWFNNEYPKEKKEIKIRPKIFQGQLIVEDYLKLESLCLQNVKNVDKVILKNLPQLQKCEIWNCGMQDLVIENCSQIKNLDVRNNHLTNLGFLANLENLEEVKLDSNTEIALELEYLPKSLKSFSYENTKLIEDLEPYNGDWKTYRKYFQELIEFTKQNLLSKAFLELREQNKSLKKELEKYKNSPELFLNNSIEFENKYQKLKGFLNFLSTEEKKKTEEIKLEKTDELKKNLEKKLFDLKKTNRELEEKIIPLRKIERNIAQQEKELEELKSNYLEKTGSYDKEKLQEKLTEFLKSQVEVTRSNSSFANEQREKIKDKIVKKTIITNDELDILCQKQAETTKLKLELEKKFSQQEKQINQIVSHIDIQELIKLLIQKELREENIEGISFCNTWFNENLAIVIGKKKNLLNFLESNTYNLWVITYEPPFGKIEGKLNYVKVAEKISPVKEEWEKIVKDFRDYLSSEYPAVKLYNNAYTTELPSLTKDYENLVKTTKILSPSDNPDNYLKPLDIVKVDRKGGIYQHVAVYLGDWDDKKQQIVHVRRDDGLGVRLGNWEDFLNDETKIEICHPFIPFKKPELIKKHIKTAIDHQYGKGEYNLWKENCEHFATLCVYGLGTCQQKGINTINEVTQGSVYLLQAIQKSNEFFEELKQWKDKGFNYGQYKEWIEAGFQPTDIDLVAFIRDNLDLSAEMVCNMENKEILKSAYREHLREQEEKQTQVQQANPNNLNK